MSLARRFRTALLVIGVVSIGLLFPGCTYWSERGAKGAGVLPPPRPGETNFSSFKPENAYMQLVPGLLSRKLYETRDKDGLRVEVRDLLVGPNQRSESVSLLGVAIFEVRSGSGVVTVAGSQQGFKLGSTFTIPDGESFTLTNKSASPIGIRVYLISAK